MDRDRESERLAEELTTMEEARFELLRQIGLLERKLGTLANTIMIKRFQLLERRRAEAAAAVPEVAA